MSFRTRKERIPLKESQISTHTQTYVTSCMDGRSVFEKGNVFFYIKNHWMQRELKMMRRDFMEIFSETCKVILFCKIVLIWD